MDRQKRQPGVIGGREVEAKGVITDVKEIERHKKKKQKRTKRTKDKIPAPEHLRRRKGGGGKETEREGTRHHSTQGEGRSCPGRLGAPSRFYCCLFLAQPVCLHFYILQSFLSFFVPFCSLFFFLAFFRFPCPRPAWPIRVWDSRPLWPHPIRLLFSICALVCTGRGMQGPGLFLFSSFFFFFLISFWGRRPQLKTYRIYLVFRHREF